MSIRRTSTTRSSGRHGFVTNESQPAFFAHSRHRREAARARFEREARLLPRVASEMALHVLAYNLTRVMNIIGVQPLLAAIRA